MNSEHVIAAKFGGSSLADAKQFRKVKEIVESDPGRRYIVPQAPALNQSFLRNKCRANLISFSILALRTNNLANIISGKVSL